MLYKKFDGLEKLFAAWCSSKLPRNDRLEIGNVSREMGEEGGGGEKGMCHRY